MEEDSNRFLEKAKKDPSVAIGLAGLTGVVLYGLYNFRKRKIAPSLYLIHLRLAGQGTIIGCLTLGVVYTLFKNHGSKLFGSEEKK